jgi:cell filamentation protein
MDTFGSGLLPMLYGALFIESQPPEALAFEHISRWHRQWPGNVYDWGGEIA